MKKDYTWYSVIAIFILLLTGTIFVSYNRHGADSSENFTIRPLQENDLVQGNRDAELVIYEYSDTECPFCKKFHFTMKQIIDKYGDRVAWVYRHFPLTQIHRKAEPEAVAVECANTVSNKGVEYLNKLFEITPSNDGLDLNELPKIAQSLGIDEDKFNACIENQDTLPKVRADAQEAVKAGAKGTPFSIIKYKDKSSIMTGAVTFEQMENEILNLLQTQKQETENAP